MCFRPYEVYYLNTNRKYSINFLFSCKVFWPILDVYVMVQLLSCPFFFFSSPLLHRPPFYFHSFLQCRALSFQSIDSLARCSPDSKVSFVLLSTCLNGRDPAAKFCNILLSWGLWLASMQISFSYAGSFHTTSGLAIGADASVFVTYSSSIV